MSIKKIFKHSLIISKRLFVRPGFLILILLIPLLVIGMRIVAAKESGVVSIALATEDKNDPVASQIIQKLTENDPIIRFTVCDTPDEAKQTVFSAKADAAWIFPKNTDARIRAFSDSPNPVNYVVDIIQREENIVLRIANERLSAALYSFCSEYMYISQIRERLPELSHLSDEELVSYYESTWAEGDVFEFGYGNQSEQKIEKVNYLTAPIRGLLYVLTVMGGLAAALFFQKDEESGFVDRIPKKERFEFEYLCHFLPIFYMSAVSVISLCLSGLGVESVKEAIIALIYSLACAPMCMILRRIFRRPQHLAVISPLFIILLLVICPVFVNTNVTRPIQILLATYYALTAVHNTKYIVFMALYAVLLTTINYLLFRRKLKH